VVAPGDDLDGDGGRSDSPTLAWDDFRQVLPTDQKLAGLDSTLSIRV
jgi:hypothetical protein